MLKEFKPNDIDLPILDMGAGYGPIGIVVNRLYGREVWMCEINERAYNLILKNSKDNKSINVKAFHSDLYEKIPNDQLFSSIITNPPIRAGKKIVFEILSGAYEHLNVGGELWIVIQKKQGAESSLKHLKTIFETVEVVNKDGGYWIIKSRK
jgi:16S rRNA (guanine1207-N2)-methyltransferase